jgi:hypothetical protein
MKANESTAKMMNEYAGEEGTVENIKGTYYYFGSELACLRLVNKYRWCKFAYSGYSETRKSFYFCLEPQF